MEIVERKDFKTGKWPNGHGVAHEVFHVFENGKSLWRLSLAEVVGACVFSRFTGQTRCTTVVSGEGMDLTSDAGQIALRPLVPATFSGELPLTGVLLDGPVENLNIVYDTDRYDVDVTVHDSGQTLLAGDMVFVVEGEITLKDQTVTSGDVVRLSDGAPVSAWGKFVLIRMRDRRI